MFLLVYVNNCSHVSDDVIIKEKGKSETGQTIGAAKSMLDGENLAFHQISRILCLPQQKSCKICVDSTPR